MTQQDIRLSVIIVNYNVKYFLEQALLSVRKAAASLPMEVFVVDNNSVDGSVEMVREKFSEVILIANSDNPGFSIANNQAIRRARGEHILLLNPDTVVEEDTFTKCLDFMEAHPDAGALGVKMIDGSGKFLPESKRGFPSPKVAFFKSSGFSRLFPRSRLFNHYHLGYLDKDQNHEVEVLSGAFMWLRKSVLDEIGLLDETFFMYGEDIDLSYRIIKAGYKNYYLAETTIIHYKGESTKKGSLNYVRTFYNAMIIFARKHFQDQKARLFILMLQIAIYLRAGLTIFTNLGKRGLLPFLDALAIGGGLLFLKDFWASYYFNNPDYYEPTFLYFNVPLYIGIWVLSIYFSGGYDKPYSSRRLIRGVLIGTLILAAVYGFLPLKYRPSRAIILLGAVWAGLTTVLIRLFLHFLRHRNFQMQSDREKNLVIVGSKTESDRAVQLLHKAEVRRNIIGTVATEPTTDRATYLNDITQLEEVVHIYRAEEIIFCGKDIRSRDIMRWMARLGPEIEYKIIPKESLSIIGSSSKHRAGQLYTVDIQYNVSTPMAQRNKRVLDIFLAGMLLLGSPVFIWMVSRKSWFWNELPQVLIGKKSWVGYGGRNGSTSELPRLRPGVFHPGSGLKVKELDEPTLERLNFFYAKDYHPSKDLDIFLRSFRKRN
jgi:GT2 family glycosyltransferase